MQERYTLDELLTQARIWEAAERAKRLTLDEIFADSESVNTTDKESNHETL